MALCKKAIGKHLEVSPFVRMTKRFSASLQKETSVLLRIGTTVRKSYLFGTKVLRSYGERFLANVVGLTVNAVVAMLKDYLGLSVLTGCRGSHGGSTLELWD